MKRLISAVLALSLFGATAAVAAPYDRGGNGYSDQGRYGNDHYRGHDNSGAIAAGVGLFALAAILASQNHRHYHQGWYNHARYGHDYGYGQGYGYSYGR